MSRLSTFISQRIDRILTRIVEGEAGTAVPQLAGILDAAGLASARTADLQQCLQRHPLAAGLALPAARAAIARLDPIRAIAGRSALVQGELERAWQRGHRCLLIDAGSDCGLERLAGRDLSNITVMGPERFAGRAEAGPVSGAGGFDLIVAPGLLDWLGPDDLAGAIAALAALLRPAGRIMLAGFVPEHLGRGWREVFLAPQAHCHERAAIAAAAREAGLHAQLFEDATGCLIWAELRPALQPAAAGDAP